MAHCGSRSRRAWSSPGEGSPRTTDRPANYRRRQSWCRDSHGGSESEARRAVRGRSARFGRCRARNAARPEATTPARSGCAHESAMKPTRCMRQPVPLTIVYGAQAAGPLQRPRKRRSEPRFGGRLRQLVVRRAAPDAVQVRPPVMMASGCHLSMYWNRYLEPLEDGV